MNTRHQITIAASAVSLCCLLAGCSPTGWSVKQLPDGSGLQEGARVTIQEKNGASYTGIFEGTSSQPSPEYMERYAATADASVLPVIGERVTMTTAVTGEKVWEGDFLGFDDRHLWVMKDGDPTELYVSSVAQLSDSRGHVLQRLNLRSMFVNGSIPLMTTLVIRTGGNTYRIPLNEIETLTPVGADGDGAIALTGNELRSSLLN